MKSLKQLCKPRKSVFDRTRRDVVLDLTDLIDEKIRAEEFFSENWRTDGMKTLLREAFRRFDGASQQGVYVLSQAMGGGKTHNMIALGLLAKHPALREKVMSDLYSPKYKGGIRVVAFTGRESDAPFGVWGTIADQLGRKDSFKSYYSPLTAPGQTAWVNLLQGEPTLILLDELAPYLEDARSKPIGDSNLARVTTTALSNLLVAVGKEKLANVCVVISDLKATYQAGGEQINQALADLQAEVGRSAMTLEPVALNTDEIYHILRTRLFEEMPAQSEIREVSQAYAEAVRDAKQMDITSASPEKFAVQLAESFPFHFAIRDLYARFRENPGFQQTRGLIRLMRVMVARLYEGGGAEETSLVHAQDLDLNDRETLAEIVQINPTLDNAISHDIASNGQAIAENIDSHLTGTDAQDACKLILVSSLANVPNALQGLSVSEIVSYLCTPGRDLSRLRKEVLGALSTKAWYLHPTRDGKLFFKNVQNLVAKLRTTAESYNRESSRKELRNFLAGVFSPLMKDCYQDVRALPPVDEIEIKSDKVALVISEPFPGGGLHPDLQKFYADLTFKNRVLFLSGQRDLKDTLIDTAAELKAITQIVGEMEAERVPDNDPQKVAAIDMLDKIRFRLLSTARETFTTLFYPQADKLMTADFLMNFTDNNYNGEKQIRDALKGKQKFTEDVTGETFRKKCEQRLFTQPTMLWSEVKKRAATNPMWQWHRADALDLLKDDLVRKDQWRESGGYVEKGPFPEPKADVQIQEWSRDDETGMVTLKLTPVFGDVIHYEVGGPATTASMTVANPRMFQTSELTLSFLCVDSKGKHEPSDPVFWRNRITFKSRTFQSDNQKMVELRTAPPVPIRYTTDGSDPKDSGGLYAGPFAVSPGTVCVLAVAEKDGIQSEIHRRDLTWEKGPQLTLDPSKPVVWHRDHRPKTTKESYEFLEMLKKHGGAIPCQRIAIVGKSWLELTFDEKLLLDAEKLEGVTNHLRGLLSEGQVAIETAAIHFPTGQTLLDWVRDVKTEIKPEEVKQ